MRILSLEPPRSAPSRSRLLHPPAIALVATSGISSQCGSAIAARLFAQVGPAGTLTLRLVFATLALLVVVRPRVASVRQVLHPRRRTDLAVMVAFGLAIAGMNLAFYEAIARIPLAVAVTVEFVGPLTLSVAGSRRVSHVLWALLAGGGVVLLAAGDLFGAVRHLDIAGIGFALVAGTFWTTYILINKETGKRFSGTSGLAGAMAVAALVVVPLGALDAGARLFRPEVLAIGLAVAVLASALPYSCEMAALRRATPRAFGILLSMAPGLAALAGFVILGQRLGGIEIAALFLVVAANVGNAWTTGRDAPAGLRAAPALAPPPAPPPPSAPAPAPLPPLTPADSAAWPPIPTATTPP